MEPAPVLVAALQVKAGRPREIAPLFKDEAMGAAGIEPDIEDVGDLLVVGRIVLRT